MQAPQIHPKDHMLQNYAELIYVDDIADLTLGDIQIYRLHPFAKYAAAKTIPKKSINYQERINFKHPSVFSNIRIQQVSSQYKIFFEYDFMSLSNVLQKRLENKQLFPEHEIWQIINQLSSAMQFLQSKNVSHGNLSAQSIFFDDEYQIFRIYDNSLLNGEMQGFYNFTLNGKIKNNNSTLKTRDQTDKTSNNASSDSNNCTMEILVAPELLKMFTNQEKPLNPNLFKSDVFSFGMLVLQMGTLLPIMECYNRETISFNYQKLSQHIHTFAQRYSPHLLNFVQQLLELDVSKRLDWNELVKITHDGYYAGIMKASQILLFQCIKQTEEDKKKHLQDQLKQLSHVIKSEKPMIIQQADNTIKTDSAPEQCFNPQQQQISPELPQQQLQQQQQQQQLQQGQQQQKVKVESTSNIDAKKIQQIQQQQQQQVQQDQQNQHVQQVQVKQVQVNLEQPQRKISKQLIQNQNLENALNKTYDLISQLKFEQDKQQVIQNQNEQQNQTLNATQIQGQTSQELKASALIQNRFLSKVTSQRQLGDSSLIINKLGVNNRVGEQKQFTDRDQGNQTKISQYFFEGMSKTIRQQIISKQNDPQNFNKQKMSNKQEFVSKSQFFDKASSKIAEGYQNVQENQGDLLSVRNSNIQVLNQIKDNNTSQIIADNVSTNRNKNSNSVQTLVASKRHNFSIAYQQGLMNASMYIEKVTKESPRLSKFDTSMNQHASNIQNKENNNNLVRQHNKSANQKEEKVVKKRDMNEALKVLNERITLTLKQSNDRTKNLRQILKKIQQN